jgi:3-(3-hydroxy-phenyl)propionate hydroxylase
MVVSVEGTDLDVVIAGGGPVGLCVAFLAAEKGLNVALFESDPAPSRDLRASTFHPPTLDMLAPSGISDELISRGLICPHWQIRLHPSGVRAVFDLSVLSRDTRYPYRLQCEQWKLSEALLSRISRQPNVQIRYGADVIGFQQDEKCVVTNISAGEERFSVRSQILVGADGARSTVRKELALGFEGETYPETTLLVTTQFPFEDHLDGLSNVSYCWKDGGNFSLLKVPGRWRVSIYPREDIDLEQQLTDASIEQNLQDIVPNANGYEVMEKRAYRVHQRIVPTYCTGRVALAGDAAHLNSPAGGMGLNGGIHDAFELVDAIGEIVLKGKPPERLALYDRRRRPIARDQIIAQADRNRQRMREKDTGKRLELLKGLQAIACDGERAHQHLLASSMIAGLRQAAQIN